MSERSRLLAFKMNVWDWRDGSTVKSTCYSHRDRELSSQHLGWVANSCLGVSNHLWGHLTHMPIPTQIHAYTSLKLFMYFMCSRKAVRLLELKLGRLQATCGYLEQNLGPFQEKYMFLTDKPFLQT